MSILKPAKTQHVRTGAHSRRPQTLLRFLVPAAARAALAAELARTGAADGRSNLLMRHLDSQGGHLARAGIGWCLRREGRRWTQSLTQQGRHAHEQLEHAVIRPDLTWDADAHAGSAILPGLRAALRDADEAGDRIDACCSTALRRTTRRVRGRAAIVDITLDDGRLMTDAARVPVHELSFGLVSGSAHAMAALAERWRKRFDLVCEPRLGSERVERLRQGIAVLPLGGQGAGPRRRPTRRPDATLAGRAKPYGARPARRLLAMVQS